MKNTSSGFNYAEQQLNHAIKCIRDDCEKSARHWVLHRNVHLSSNLAQALRELGD